MDTYPTLKNKKKSGNNFLTLFWDVLEFFSDFSSELQIVSEVLEKNSSDSGFWEKISILRKIGGLAKKCNSRSPKRCYNRVPNDLSSENHRNWAGLCALTVSCRCCKSYLPCSKRSENIINRKIGNFYIEAIFQKRISTPKKIFFSSSKKIQTKNLKIWKNQNFQISKIENFVWKSKFK